MSGLAAELRNSEKHTKLMAQLVPASLPSGWSRHRSVQYGRRMTACGGGSLCYLHGNVISIVMLSSWCR
jgi:hypothetical protein